MTSSRRAQLLLHVSAGGLVIVAAVLADDILGRAPGMGTKQLTLAAAGMGILLLGFARSAGRVARVSTHLCVSMLTVLLLLATLEAFVRVTGFEFFREEQAWREVPVFYRVPTDPTGTVFFKRPGPDRWSGQVLNTQLRHLGIVPNPYANEPSITVEYDRRGFRNSDRISDWLIAVAGDSHTEMGYLPQDQLFTSIMSTRLHASILNLGVSDTGPLTQLHYLEEYGLAASTRHVAIVFFEGNDLDDLGREHAALERWHETGQREYRLFSQGSFLRPLYMLARRVLYDVSRRGSTEYVAAYFRSPQGAVPMSLLYAPPGSADLSYETRRQLEDFLMQYARFARRHRVEPSLVYMPAGLRVLYRHIDFAAGAPETLRNWKPTDLPDAVAALCTRYGIRFVDLTSALVRATNASGRLLYNAIYDMHLNADGSHVVAEELATHFSIVVGTSGPAEAGHHVRGEAGR